MLSEWPLSDTYIWYVQFTCPSTANYKNLQFFCTLSSTPTYNGTLGVAIYSNSAGQPGAPNSLIASGTQTFTNADMDNRYVDILFSSAASLEANKLYWVAIAGDHNSGELIYSGFHNDYHGAYGIVRYQTSGFSGSFPPTAGIGTTGEYAYWFRIY